MHVNRKGHVTLATTREQSLYLYKHSLLFGLLEQILCAFIIVFKRSLNLIVKDLLSSIKGHLVSSALGLEEQIDHPEEENCFGLDG